MTLATPGFHSVTLVVSTLDPSLAFYGEVLGLVQAGVADDPEEGGAPLHFLRVGGEGSIGHLTLLHLPGGERGRWGVGGIHHLALSVPDEEGLLRWKRRLTDHGVPVTGPYDRGYFHSIYFQDSDGHVVEIATAGPGYAIDEPADQLGGELITPPDERLREHRDERAIRALTHPDPVPEIDSGMALTGLHHVTGITGELDDAHDFFTTALGLHLVKRTVNQDDGATLHHVWARYRNGEVSPGSSITLFGWPGSDYQARDGVGQTRSYAWQAATDDELEGWMEQLRTLGIPASDPKDRGYFRAISFRAPDGQRMELATPPVWPAPEGGTTDR